MNDLSKNTYKAPAFSHIYVEEEIAKHPMTEQILSHFPKARVISIHHYKDVFNRRGQRFDLQHESQNLILAKQTGHFLYEGAKVCHDFGNRHFYYCSSVKNCIYDCEYCYLKGMYPSANLVVYVNLEDTFRELENVLAKHPVYLCVSYDSDLLALEGLLGYCRRWVEFASTHAELTIEIRTKSAGKNLWEKMPPLENVVYAFTLSPKEIADRCEHYTPGVEERIRLAVEGIQRGYPVRLVFDPMLYVSGFEQAYCGLLESIDRQMEKTGVSYKQVKDVSIGSFRISQDYLKPLRKNSPKSPVTQFPYVNVRGVYQYPEPLANRMESFLYAELCKRIPQEKLYREFRQDGESEA